MNIGTTMTATLASIGGSVGARRTGFSHVIYNLLTAFGAFLLITPYTMVWNYAAPGELVKNAEIALVAFHTSFNALGVIIILPFTNDFARFMEKIIPDKESLYARKLGSALLESPELALNAVQETIKIQSIALFRHVNAILGDKVEGERGDLNELQSALNETQGFVDRIGLKAADGAAWERIVQMIHTLDHLQRLHERCEEEEDRAITAREAGELKEECALLINSVVEIIRYIDENKWVQAAKLAKETSKQIHTKVRPFRSSVMSRVAQGEIDVYRGTDYLESIRWMRRVSRHIQRINEHVEKSFLAAGR